MEPINITPEVIKLLEEFKKKGVKESIHTLEQALYPGRIQVFQKPQSSEFWIEGDGQKWAVKHVITRLQKEKKLIYQEKKEESPIKKVMNKVLKKEEDLHSASVLDLQAFIKKYMKGYKVAAKFKKEKLSDEENAAFWADLKKNYTEGITKAIEEEIYGGKKPNYRGMNKMSDEERALFKEQAKEEHEWFLDNLIWLAKPSKKYVQEHKKPTTNNYQHVAADLSSCVQNGIYIYRSSKIL